MNQRDEWVRQFNAEIERTDGRWWREYLARAKTQAGGK
jgi:hypothetical protein